MYNPHYTIYNTLLSFYFWIFFYLTFSFLFLFFFTFFFFSFSNNSFFFFLKLSFLNKIAHPHTYSFVTSHF
ncbi:hypothetical protein RchiOBHm_Chr2g0085041 [Rosa chinensis]|uniref:Uncharacterized protein n=1 Tax=Rosa chinensis TaxID=74649 RepID=A0A2P6RI04_ROSCH|nr:hypothetical protein RchiOBHm_Chr2g0085041 [Rosa chinensis]